MKLTIIFEKLKEGIKTVERMAQKSLSLPVLQNVYLKVEKNFLCLAATNLEVGIKYWSLVKMEKEGEILVPARVFSQLTDFLPQGAVTLEKKENDLLVSSQNYKSKIKGLSADEFPIIPETKGGESISISCVTFCQAIGQVVDIASPSAARPEIAGIYFLFQKDMIKIVATDSFRLGEQKLFLKNSITQDYSLILPQQAAKEIINIFGQKEGDLKIYFSSNQLLIESNMQETNHPQVQLVSRLVEGNYPDYEAIIPQKTETQIQVGKSEFLNQIKSASLFAGRTSEISLKIDPQKEEMEIASQNQDLGEYQSSLPSKVKGKEVVVAFNHHFLAEGLVKIKSPNVIFELCGQDGPAIFRPQGQEQFLYVVMPIKGN
jgi:DNA polymerase III subunit beta